MKIAYNPISAAALTAVPKGNENDILFDLKGLNIFAKGVRFKGTDTTYSVFKKHTSTSGGGYNGLVPVPSYTTTNIRYLREDGTWQIPDNNHVTQVQSTAANFRPVILGYQESSDPSQLATTITNAVYTTTKIYARPNTGTLYATKFKGAIDLDNADNKMNLLIRVDHRNLTDKDLNTARFNFGQSNKGDDTEQLNAPTKYGTYLSLAYSNKNQAGQLYFDTVPGTLGSLYFRTRNAGDSNTVDTWKPWKKVFCVGDNIDWSNITNKPSSYTPNAHNHPSSQVTALTSYAKATSSSALTTADSLNVALGKLEFKADLGVSAYNIVSAAVDGDGTIENLNEILKVLQGISDTATIQGILGNYAKLKSPNDLVHNGNEITMVPSEYSGSLWFNYRTCGGYNGDIQRYVFGNGNQQRTLVEASGYIKTGSSDSYFLLGGGGHKPISDFALKTDLNNYVTLNTAQTITGKKTFTADTIYLDMASQVNKVPKNSSTAGWSRNMIEVVDSSDNLFFNFGTLGNGDTFKYAFIGTGDYNSTQNLRIASNGLVSSPGYVKFGSNDNYLLLGGGGHKAISDFMLKSDELNNNLTTITKSLTVTQAWMDTGISGTSLPADGTYIVQVTVNAADATGNMYGCINSGIMSWRFQNTNDTEADEIILHRAGHAYGNVIYLRTIMQPDASGKVLKLQISANTNIGAAYNYTFKFKRII